MPSTTRGSILISTANDIGEALVEKLGGVGYSPNEWKEKYNLCGIAPIDSAPALSVLADSAGTGDERGSILIATADAIGAILNKKYNVLRGFKPKEWASACRKMKALEDGNVASASIASFSDGADTVPLTSCVCSIDANLDGKTAVNAVHTRKNLVNSSLNEQGSINATTGANVNSDKRIRTTYIKINANTTYSISIGGSVNLFELYQYKSDGTLARAYIAINAQTYTFTSHADAVSIRFSMRYADNSVIQTSAIENLQLEQSSEPTTYEEYSAETKTADLGRAVYGGQTDIIKGEGVESAYKLDDFTDITVINNSTTSGSRTFRLNTPSDHYRKKDLVIMSNLFTVKPLSSAEPYCVEVTDASSSADVTHGIYFSLPLSIAGAAEAKQWLIDNNAVFVYNVETPVDFTFEPVKIDSFPGVNNIWNDCGNTAVEYYQAPTPYARKTATGGIANFSDQRTDLPLTKAIANIAPSIAGKSAVNLVRAGKNLFDKTKATTGKYINVSGQEATNEAKAHSELLPINPSTSYYMSGHADASYYSILALDKDMNVLSTWYGGASKTESFVATTPSNARWCYLNFNADQIDTMIFAESATAISYEPYNGETYTAELGETVYGGSVDFVSGEVQKTWGAPFTWTSGMSGVSVNANGVCYINKSDVVTVNASNQTTLVGCKCSDSSFESRTWAGLQNSSTNGCACVYGNGIAIRIAGYTTKEEYETYLSSNPLTFVYMVKEPTESTIPGRVISPIEGANNYWNDAGGDTEIQYFENEA